MFERVWIDSWMCLLPMVYLLNNNTVSWCWTNPPNAQNTIVGSCVIWNLNLNFFEIWMDSIRWSSWDTFDHQVHLSIFSVDDNTVISIISTLLDCSPPSWSATPCVCLKSIGKLIIIILLLSNATLFYTHTQPQFILLCSKSL